MAEDYYALLEQAKRNYNDAVSQIKACQNRINVLEREKKVLKEEKQEKKRKKKAYGEALEKLIKLKKENGSETMLTLYKTNVIETTEELGEMYRDMVYHNEVQNKNIDLILSPQIERMKQRLDSFFEGTDEAIRISGTVISVLEEEIESIDNSIEEKKEKIKNNKSDKSDYETKKVMAAAAIAHCENMIAKGY